MKRFIAYFLMVLMLLINVQPTLAMHFCGGKLASISLYQESSSCSVCGIQHQDSKENLQFHAKSCCADKSVQLTTDNFSQKSSLIELIGFHQLGHNFVMPIPHLIFDWNKNRDISLSELQRDFPPQGLSRNSYSLIDFICIYRI